MLYIDPDTCIDCGACVEACPVDAIHYEEDLTPDQARFKDINAAFFQRHPLERGNYEGPNERRPVPAGALRVALVGSGPAACYAAADLVAIDGVEVDIFEKLPTPFGLIRAGVAPDHQATKSVVKVFDQALSNDRLACHLNIEVGEALTHDDLMAHHHAVVYAVGASSSRYLGIPGEELDGNHAAADFVGWYNGHPDHIGHEFDLSTERAVVVGNGNVALDVARVLLMAHERLAETDIAQHALDALSRSNIREVVVLGRRGPRDAAFSAGEFLALGHIDGVDVVIDGGDLESGRDDDVETATKLELAREYSRRTSTPGNRQIIFRFLTTPIGLKGEERVDAIRVVRDGVEEDIPTSLVLRSIGYQGEPIAGTEFDAATGRIRNESGRVVDHDGNPINGVYVTGWIKRGPRGVIGTNRICAQETIEKLLSDFADGRLTRDIKGREALVKLMSKRGLSPIDWKGWRSIDSAERLRGQEVSRPRLKFVGVGEMLSAVDVPT
jgi:ferredoxin--NADP+ reductase